MKGSVILVVLGDKSIYEVVRAARIAKIEQGLSEDPTVTRQYGLSTFANIDVDADWTGALLLRYDRDGVMVYDRGCL